MDNYPTKYDDEIASLDGYDTSKTEEYQLMVDNSTGTSVVNTEALSLEEGKRISDFASLTEGVKLISNWKRYKRVPAKILEISDDFVLLECLINKDAGIYKEKRFSKELLDEVNIEQGRFLLFNYYKKGNELKIQILDNQSLVSDSEFPAVDFSKYEKSNFFSKKDK